jgi:hypothetical protein
MENYVEYPNSSIRYGNSKLFIVKENNEKFLYIFGKSDAYDLLKGETDNFAGIDFKRCPLSNANAKIIRKLFPFTNPVSHKNHSFTLGLGDRLGLASPGHIRLIKDLNVFPILAQQSIRELNLTGRTYDDVLSAAVWAVFQEGYKKGYGADGDHLKTYDEVKMALDCGFTMITLDCSEHIRNEIMTLNDSEIDSRYNLLNKNITGQFEEEYVDKTINLANLKKIVLIYLSAINHTINIYNSLLYKKDIDFEISIDETSFTTSPEAHYFIANELQKAGVKITSLAPRFCGEFQKGIDYKGDVNKFAEEFAVHRKIAKIMGYKLSVHSGSDKFAVFPIIYKETERVVHLKTAGTNWLEALRVIAQKNPGLFREIFKFALVKLPDAKKVYNITENTANIPDIDYLKDSELPVLLDHNDARQVLHVTYGSILMARNDDGTSIYKDAIYATLNDHEEDYYNALIKHIGKHIE